MWRSILILMILVISRGGGSSPAAAAEEKPKYGPKVAPKAIPLALSNAYFRSGKHPAPDFWALIGFYVPQFNEAGCSVASVAMVVNAARARLPKSSEEKVVSQQALLDKVEVENWKQRMSAAGFRGEHGMTLDQLGKAAVEALKSHGFKNSTVKVVHLDQRDGRSKEKVIEDLRKSESSPDDFIIANFNQKEFTDDAEVGHFAPVGAFDAERGRVLILDPDREYYEPYWVSVDTFLAGMATRDAAAGANRGYLIVRPGP